MQYFLEMFGNITLSSVITFIAAIAFLVAVSVKVYKFVIKAHDEEQDRIESLKEIKDDVKNIQRTQSSFETIIAQLLEGQDKIAERQDKIEKEAKKRDMNRLKDNLLQSYKFYTNPAKNPLMAWSEMEKEAFFGLFDDYEKLGGDGFMHSIVEPAMIGLNVIAVTDTVGFENLMKSRKG